MSLKLITTETFNNLDCNFYRNSNDEVLLTREQIGTALEYDNPREAIKKIHKHHKERLDQLSFITKLNKGGVQLDPSFKGGEQNTYLYNTKGVMEICRWSRQEKANQFMDFVWNVMDKLLHKEPINSNETINQLLQQNQNMMQSLLQSQNTMITMLTTITSTLPQPYKPPYTRWIKQIYEKVNILKERYDTTTKAVLCKCYREIEVAYDIDLSTYQQDYELRHNLNTSYMLNVIDENSTLRQFLDIILDNEIELIDDNIREEKSLGRKP